MQNKPNFENEQMNINIDILGIYKILSRWRGAKTKPIQTQLKPKQTQFKPNLTQNKPNSKPIKANRRRTLEFLPNTVKVSCDNKNY